MENRLIGQVNRKPFVAVKQITDICLLVFLFSVVFFPNDTFNTKIVSLGALLLLTIPYFFRPLTADESITVWIGLIYTSIVIIFSIALTGDVMGNIRAGYPGYILMLYPLIKRSGFRFEHWLILLLKVLAVFTIAVAALDVLHIVDLTQNRVIMWFAQSDNAMVGKGAHLPIGIMIFMKTSPMMFLGLFYSLRRKQYISALGFFAALILSGTRANMLVAIASVVFYMCCLEQSRRLRRISLVVAVTVGLIVIWDGRILDFLYDMFQRKAGSDSVRSGHLKGILEFWAQNPVAFFTGSGFISEFYSYGTNTYLSNIELSYWNLLRQVGLVAFLFFIAVLVVPVIGLSKRSAGNHYILAYLCYLVIAYTNPFLYSSTGFTVILFLYWYCFCEVRKNGAENNGKKIHG